MELLGCPAEMSTYPNNGRASYLNPRLGNQSNSKVLPGTEGTLWASVNGSTRAPSHTATSNINTPQVSDIQISFYIWMFPKNRGTPKSSILIGFSIINHPFWGTPIFGNTHLFPNYWT